MGRSEIEQCLVRPGLVVGLDVTPNLFPGRYLIGIVSQLSPMHASEFPSWLNPDCTARAGLHERWRELNRAPAPLHPHRPEAYQKLTALFWSAYFESLDPGMTLLPLEIRSPLFDVRLVSYLLAIPPLPWTADKELLRVARRGILPEAVRLRPKTPLACDPVLAKLRRPQSRWIDGFVAEPKLSEYVAREKIPPVTSPYRDDDAGYYVKLLPLALDLWFKSDVQRKSQQSRRENHGIRGSQSRKEEISSTATVGLWRYPLADPSHRRNYRQERWWRRER